MVGEREVYSELPSVEVTGITHPMDFPIISHLQPYVQVAVEEEVEVPTCKPDIEQVISILVKPKLVMTKVIATPVGLKLVVKGSVEQKILYVADLPEQSVHAFSAQIPFCTFIQLPEEADVDKDGEEEAITRENIGKTSIIVEDVIVQQVTKRTVQKCAILFVWTNLVPTGE